MKRRILSRILVFALILALLPTGAFADTAVYTDTETHWAKAAIEKWSGLGIIQGADGKFRPDDSITRGETAVILDRVMQYVTKSQNSFTDLGQDFYTDAMLKANAAGILKGDAGTIRPSDKITREEAVVVLGRALGLAESQAGTAFTDSSSISSWASGYVNAMVARGYIQGAGGLFNPKAPITRAEFVTILDNSIAKIFHEATSYTESIVGTVVVNVPGAVLKNMTVTGDLILSEGVGEGDVTLENVTVTGRTIVRGGGANSIHVTGDSKLSEIYIEKRDDGSVRIVTADGAEVDAVYVDDGSDDIILTGDFKSVTIAEGVSVKAVDASIQSVSMTGAATFDVDAKSTVDTLTAAGTAAGASVTVAGKVGTLTADAKITVDNDGTITKAVVNADGVVVGGNKPSTVTVGSSVTDEPVDGKGDPLVTPTTGGGGGGGSTTPSLSVSVTKLETVAADTNYDDSAANQELVKVAKSGNTITVSGDYVALKVFASTDTSQNAQPHKWVGLAIDTGLSTIVGVKYNGTALTADDVAEAASVDVGAGKFVLWVKADELISTDKTFTLGKAGYSTKTMTVKFVDSEALTGTVTALAPEKVPNDDNKTVCAANQGKIEVTKAGDTYTVTGNFGALNSFPSTVLAQGTHQWIGLVVATGQDDITKVKYGTNLMTGSDVADAESVGAPAGSFVLWLKVDEVVETGVSFTLSQDGRPSKTVTITFVDTKPLTGSVTKLAPANVNQTDGNTDASEANQVAVSVTKDGDTYTVSGHLGELNSFTSTNTDQDDDPYKWVGLVVDTNQTSILGVKYGSYEMKQADVDEAASVNVGTGKFVLWIKAEEVYFNPITFTLSQVGRAGKEITVRFVDTTPLTGTVTKLAKESLVNDANKTASGANQDAVTVTQQGNAVTVTADTGALNSFTSTNTDQDDAPYKWVGLVVATGQPSIIGVKFNTYEMKQSDVDEAASVGVGAGSFVLWLKADVVIDTPYTFTLSQEGKTDKEITVSFVDTKPLTGTVTKLAAVNQTDGNKEVSEANQAAVSVTKDGDTYTVSGDLVDLNSFESTVSLQGTHKWVGLVVDTNQTSIIGVKYGTYEMKQSDVDEAASVNVGAGKFVLWIKAEEVAADDITFTLSQMGRVDKEITVRFNDTTPFAVTVSKLETVAQDANALVSQANQNKVTVTTDQNDMVTVSYKLSELNAFASTAPGQGTHKWIGLVVDTGLSSIIGVKFCGVELTAADVAEAASVGVPAGKFVFWVKADEMTSIPKTFPLSKATGRLIIVADITITFDDTTPAGPQVAAVSNIHYEKAGDGNILLEFTRPEDQTGISNYSVEFSTDGGDTWEENGYLVAVDSDSIVPMGDAVHGITHNTTYDQVRVTSLADVGSGYTYNSVTANISLTFTVSGSAVEFMVTKNDTNDYTLLLTNAAVENELYAVKVTKTGDTAPNYYPLGFIYYYDSDVDLSATDFPLKGDGEYTIADDSLFVVRKITDMTVSGDGSVASMTVSAYAAPIGETTES